MHDARAELLSCLSKTYCFFTVLVAVAVTVVVASAPF